MVKQAETKATATLPKHVSHVTLKTSATPFRTFAYTRSPTINMGDDEA